MHRNPKTGKYESDNKKVERGTSSGKKAHVHFCSSCESKWIHKCGTIMISHFIPFCMEDYFAYCDKCKHEV